MPCDTERGPCWLPSVVGWQIGGVPGRKSRFWILYSRNSSTEHEEHKQAGFTVDEVLMGLNLVSEKCLPGFVLQKSNTSTRSLVQLLAE